MASIDVSRRSFLDLSGELRNLVYAHVKSTLLPRIDSTTDTLKIRKIRGFKGCLASNPHGARGPVSLAQICHRIRSEWLPLLMSEIHGIGLSYGDAMEYLPQIVPTPRRSTVLPADFRDILRGWHMWIDIAGLTYSRRGFDLLPLLKLISQAQLTQQIEVHVHDDGFCSSPTEFKAVMVPGAPNVAGRNLLIASAEKVLAASPYHAGLVIVVKDGVGPSESEDQRMALVRSFGLESGWYAVMSLQGFGGGLEDSEYVYLDS